MRGSFSMPVYLSKKKETYETVLPTKIKDSPLPTRKGH